MWDEAEQRWISDAEVTETGFAAFWAQSSSKLLIMNCAACVT